MKSAGPAQAASGESTGRAPALWSRSYTLLCLTVLLAYTHQALLAPTLPLYVTDLGGSVVLAGFVLAAFAVVSFAVRPLVGYASDNWSPYRVQGTGSLILGASGLALLIPSFGILVIANAARGIGWAALNTASYALLARVSPVARRSEASGYYSVATNAAMAFAPALALWLIATPGWGFGPVFVLSVGSAFAAALVARMIVQRGSSPNEPRGAQAGAALRSRNLAAFVDPGVLLASALLLCVTVTYAPSSAFVPLYARQMGIENTGGYFIASGTVSILARLFFNRLLDRGGRGLWIAIGFGLMIAGLFLLLIAASLEVIILAGAVHALGSSISNPILLALAIDRSDPRRLGASMATYSMSYQIGTAVGAPASGFLIQFSGYPGMYLGAIAALGAGLFLTAVNWRALGTRPEVVPWSGGSRG